MPKPSTYLLGALVLAALAGWVDAPLTQFIHANLTPSLDDFFDDVSDIANSELYALTALGAYGTGLFALSLPTAQRWAVVCQRLVRGGLLLLLTMLTGGLITLVLKHVVARARPSQLLEHGYYGLATPFSGSPFNSFPSSHTLTAFAVAAVLAKLLPAWRWPLLALAAIVAACILTLEHFLSDVVAAALIALACTHFWAPRVLSPQASWPLRQPWRWHKAS
ncbi:MAG: hypothetical protein GAK30_01654 [Paracidovorax wautersii]|uniref:Phosphatidic acid phosphatase type 2/haloperoxidase domain-containing protein n=1 Tax=Paracidovorax wautersii TaxID=1177982 RepID=A0A7V8JQX0_9BURK|nr:MAG: hypothetical protein GAK30_01654 [Paracidovorax wautersii]